MFQSLSDVVVILCSVLSIIETCFYSILCYCTISIQFTIMFSSSKLRRSESDGLLQFMTFFFLLIVST